MRDTFDDQGYVIVRGLLEPSLLNRLDMASDLYLERIDKNKQTQVFSSFDFGPVFAAFDGQDEEEKLSAFYETAVSSAVPRLVEMLLKTTRDDEDSSPSSAYSPPPLRVLKDALLCKGAEPKFCGWHVDDWVFWPTTQESQGINAWIALDDMPSCYGGSIAVSPQSHVAPWRHQAYEAIGSTPMQNQDEGLVLGSELSKKGILITCDMQDLAPALAAQMEDSRHVFDYQKGDVLFHTRWLFHRSIPVTQAGIDHYCEKSLQKKVALRRYSIRYESGSARLQKGVNIEPCVLLNPACKGKTLDEVCETEGPWYPICSNGGGASPSSRDVDAMQKLVQEKFPDIAAKNAAAFQTIMPYISQNNK